MSVTKILKFKNASILIDNILFKIIFNKVSVWLNLKISIKNGDKILTCLLGNKIIIYF